MGEVSNRILMHSSTVLCNVLQAIGEIKACGCRRQRFVVLLIELYGFFDDLTQFFKDLFLIVTVTSTENQSRCTSDIALVFVRPFNDLCLAERTARI